VDRKKNTIPDEINHSNLCYFTVETITALPPRVQTEHNPPSGFRSYAVPIAVDVSVYVLLYTYQTDCVRVGRRRSRVRRYDAVPVSLGRVLSSSVMSDVRRTEETRIRSRRTNDTETSLACARRTGMRDGPFLLLPPTRRRRRRRRRLAAGGGSQRHFLPSRPTAAAEFV